MSAEEILVIILSITLAVFLSLGIVVMVLVIQIVQRIKMLTERAEELAEKAEAVGEFFHKTAGPAALIKAIGSIARNFANHNKAKNKE